MKKNNKQIIFGQPYLATFGVKAVLSPSRGYHNTTAFGGGCLLLINLRYFEVKNQGFPYCKSEGYFTN